MSISLALGVIQWTTRGTACRHTVTQISRTERSPRCSQDWKTHFSVHLGSLHTQ